MKSKIYITTWIFAIFVLFQNSCSENWLDPNPLSFYAPENIFVDKEGFDALIVTMRKSLLQENHGGHRALTVNETSLSDLGVPGTMSNQVAKDLDIMLTPVENSLENYTKLFNISYLEIKNTNTLISKIDLISWESELERNELLAEAYFFRSYWYYRLIHAFGDVPFIGQEISSPKLDFYTHSRGAILKKIISDMEFAVEWLPVNAVIGAATKGAGDHLLTKLYLANSDFDKAIESATRVIGGGKYSLMKNRFGIVANDPIRNVIWDLFRPENISIPQNTETILAAIDRYEAPSDAKTIGCRKPAQYGMNWWGVRVLDSQGKPGTMLNPITPMRDSLLAGNTHCRFNPFYKFDIWNDGTYTWENTTDLRRSDICWIDPWELRYNRPQSVDFNKPINWQYYGSATDTFQWYTSWPYYKCLYPAQESANKNGGNGDHYVFRLAETYLLRAEAYFWKNDLINAANDINQVRERANAIPVLANEVTIDYIMDERARELATEEPRNNELTRVSYIMAENQIGGYNMEDFSVENYLYDRIISRNLFYRTNYFYNGTYRISPYHVLWPIPNTVITANTMGVINQNQGYFGTEKNVPPLEVIE